MQNSRYIWSDHNDHAESARLRLLEACFDPRTIATLSGIEGLEGSACLEAGAGAGSIAKWLADKVRPSGKVVAVDKDVRFLAGVAGLPNVEVRVLDLIADELPPVPFDLIHARLLLLHIPEREHLLNRFFVALKPGGTIVLEEPDLTTLCPCASGPEADSLCRVLSAIIELHRLAGADPVIGRNLPIMVQRAGFVNIRAKGSVLITHGGEPHSQWVAQNVLALRRQLVSAGLANDQDITAIARKITDKATWLVGFNLVTVLACRAAD